MARILIIGIATLDIINSVDGYPAENTEVRASKQQLRRGGNAANTAAVLAQLGHDCDWAGTISADNDGEYISADLQQYGVNTRYRQQITNGHTPTSYIIQNSQNGSRSIVHYRDLPEFSLEMFNAIDLSQYDWLHMEGRNCDVTRAMLYRARKLRPDLTISIEIEKLRPGIDSLQGLADLLFFSSAYIQQLGYQQANPFLIQQHNLTPSADIVCAWGELGAWAAPSQCADQTNTSDILTYHSTACPPHQVIDTLAAGDTFNAAVIHARWHQQSLARAIEYGCQVAGYKCGIQGLQLDRQVLGQMMLGQTLQTI